MNETVKLIIEIPEEDYEHIKQCYESHDIVGATYSYIYHGKPLSEVLTEIREEIKALDEGITSYDHDDPWIYKREALEVIDKHISGERGQRR